MASTNANIQAPAAFLWQYEKNEEWCTFSEADHNFINRAFLKRQKTVTLSQNPEKKLNINFSTMIQKNKVDGSDHRLRCLVHNQQFYLWQFQNGDGSFTSYSPEVVATLENAYQHKEKKVNFTRSNKYEITMKSMTEKNLKTGAEKAVDRQSVDIPIKTALIKRIIKESFKCIASFCDPNSERSPNPKRKKSNDGNVASAIPIPNLQDNFRSATAVVPVDSECHDAGDHHVHCEDNVTYDVMLNQTSLQRNNNKFYVIQLLKHNKLGQYFVWNRWGRVGQKGNHTCVDCETDLEKAKKLFEKKFYDKTGNLWANAHKFSKIDGKYDRVKLNYAEPPRIKIDGRKIPSKLDAKVFSLMELICDQKRMEEAMKNMEYDCQKTPLGRLTAEQITAGYLALSNIVDVINSNGRGLDLLNACNEFYTRIPHKFGMRTLPIIDDMEKVKGKIKMLEALSEITTALKLMNKKGTGVENPIDKYYQLLECDLRFLDHSEVEYKVIEKYFKQTHAPTHLGYSMSVIDIFECSKNSQKFKNCGNNMLLWHGSRITNWVGILTSGLRIAPPEAPITGYMFGKGIYFADMSSKSANYCFPTKKQNEGLLLLCLVSLGTTKELYYADYNASRLPNGYNSVKGMGKVRPKDGDVTHLHDALVPFGKPENVTDDTNIFTLNYNEYIVYDIHQVQMKYLVRVKFNLK